MKRLAFLLCAACGSGVSTIPDGIQQYAALRSVEGCANVERTIQDLAVAEMRHRLEGSQRIMPMTAGGAGAAAAPSAYTTTNLHVDGVDEPDQTKNDGTRIFTLAGQNLQAVTSWPPGGMQLASTTALGGYPESMFLDEKSRLAVFSRQLEQQAMCMGMCPVGMGIMCGCGGPSTTRISLLDATNEKQLAKLGELTLPGSSAHSRRIGAQLYVVLVDQPRWPKDMQWWSQDIPAAEAANEKLIRAQPLDAWLPPATFNGAPMPYDCTDFHVGNASVQLGFVTVATVDLDHLDTPPHRATVVGEASSILATKQSLYVAAPHWWWRAESGQEDWTYVHKFALTPAATYVASGGFAGHPVGEDSLSEDAAGKLRVAANLLTWSTTTQPVQSNALTVLDEKLQPLAVLKDFSPNESVRSARFIGDLAYVTTFRGIDPLFVIDVSAAPRVVGKLEVPGFSTYLQPMDSGHLLAIGVDMDASGTWQSRSLQLSVFDVTNPAQPVRSATAKVGSAYAWSEALWDNHAFNWFPEKGLLAVPYSDWTPDGSQFTSAARVFGVTTGILTDRGALSLADLYVSSHAWSWRWSPWVRRTVMASSDTATYVYAVSDAGIRVAAVDDLTHPLATVPFPQ